jgi:cell division protein FtsQ
VRTAVDSLPVLSRRRRQRTRRRLTGPLLVLAAVVTLVAVAWGLLTSPLFAVRTITVKGTSRLTTGQVLAAAAIHRGSPLVRVDVSAVRRRVARLPAVAAVSVRRSWPHGVVIDVVERQPVAVVVGGGRDVLVDRGGVGFAAVAQPPPGLVPVYTPSAVSSRGAPAAPDARAAVAVLQSLPPTVRREVVGLQAPTAAGVVVELQDARQIIWGAPTDTARKLAAVRLLWRRGARVIDVTTPGVAVVRGAGG